MRRLWILSGFVAAVGCGGASADNGLTARLRLSNGQFVPGALQPSTDATGPVANADLGVSKLYPGAQNIPLNGAVVKGTSVLVGFGDDVGHWIVPAPQRDMSMLNSDKYNYSTRMTISPDAPLGTETLIIRGVDADGNVGPADTHMLTIAESAAAPAMTILLEWDTNADLDLHAVVPVDPNIPLPAYVMYTPTVEVYSKQPYALPPGNYDKTDPDMAAALAGVGHLDLDSNGGCVIDGRRQERITFADPPLPGQYIVRVDAFSMCGQASAQWRVSVFRGGNPDDTVVNPATWQAIDADTRGDHGLGAGRLALDFPFTN